MKNKNFYQHIIQKVPFGYAYHEIILDEKGKPADYRFVEVNEAFEKLTGLKNDDLIGRTVREVLPGIEKGKFDWIGFYGKIALEGGEASFHQYSEPLGRWYYVSVYSTEKMFFTTIFTDFTDQKLKEEALLESEEKFRSVFNQSTEGIYLHDMEGRILEVNEMACKQSGYSRQEWLSRNIFDGLPGESAANHTKEEILRLWAEWVPGQEYTVQGEHQRKDGTVYPVEISTGIIRYKDENVIIAIVQDITERKLSEEALRQSEEFNRKLLATIPDLVIRTDIEGNIIFVNEPGLKNFPFLSKKELLGKNMLSFIHKKDLERAAKNTRLMFEKPLGVKEYTLNFGDSNELICEVNGAIVRGAGNNPIGMVFVIRDNTERIEADRALRERESRLQKIFEILPAGLWFADKHGKLMVGNPAGVKIWGAEPKVPIEEYGVFKARRLPSGEEIKADEWALAKTIRDGITVTDELLEIDTFDGKKRTILNYTAPVNDDDGELLGAIVLNWDITDRVKAQEKLRLSEERLSSLIGAIPDAIFFKDGEGRWLVTNKTAKDLYKLHNYNWFGKTDAQLAKERPEFADAHQACIAGDDIAWKKGSLIIDHETLVDEQGKTRHYEVRKMPLFHADGRQKALVIIGEDVTERKISELELKKRMEELERFHKITIGRELNMIELKKEVNDLLEKLGDEKKYTIRSDE